MVDNLCYRQSYICLTDVTAAVEIQQQQQQQQQRQQQQLQKGRIVDERRICALARFYCSQNGWDDGRARIIAESREGRPSLRRIYMVQFSMKVNGLADIIRTIRNHRFCYILLK